MRTRVLLLGTAAIGVLAAFVASPANAQVTSIFDELNSSGTQGATRIALPGTPQTSPVDGNGNLVRGGPIGFSFSAPYTETSLDELKLTLLANTPSDGGTVDVYLVQNAAGPGSPANHPVDAGSGNSLTLGASKTLLGTIADSLLTTTAATYTLSISDLLAKGEYWIVLTNPVAGTSSNVASTARWATSKGNYTGGTGTAGQSIFWQAGGAGTNSLCTVDGVPCVMPDSSNPPLYEAELLANSAVPEPASLAILGVSLAGLGVSRRRRQRLRSAKTGMPAVAPLADADVEDGTIVYRL